MEVPEVSGRCAGGLHRVAPFIHPPVNGEPVAFPRAFDELPGARCPSAGVCSGVETALDEGEPDHVFRYALFPEDAFHHADISSRTGKPDGKTAPDVLTEDLDVSFHTSTGEEVQPVVRESETHQQRLMGVRHGFNQGEVKDIQALELAEFAPSGRGALILELHLEKLRKDCLTHLRALVGTHVRYVNDQREGRCFRSEKTGHGVLVLVLSRLRFSAKSDQEQGKHEKWNEEGPFHPLFLRKHEVLSRIHNVPLLIK
jgi:hypothetical protein